MGKYYKSPSTSKKGMSEVISAVLLILITIAAIFIVSSFVLPFIKKNLQKGQSCLDVRDQAEIDVTSGYTCYTNANTSVMIKRGNLEFKGFLVSFTKDGSGKTYEIVSGAVLSGVKMFNQATTLALPKKNGAETYVFNTPGIERVEVAPILPDGTICQSVAAEVPECFF